jgi:hypothetical protein
MSAKLLRPVAAVILPLAAWAADSAPALSDAAIENFLRTARVIRSRELGTGITNSKRATLSDGQLTHDAHIQVIDEAKANFQSAMGSEMNFRDTWKFNVAGYKLARLLGLHNVPVSVERKVGGQSAAVTWWVDDVQMMEGERQKKKVQPPDLENWNRQMQVVRVFDQLIYNTDRNMQNLLITHDWKLWMIDHTRAFRMHKDLKEPRNLTRCDRRLLARLEQLDEATLKRELKPYVNDLEIKGLLGRRDKIVQRFRQLVTEKGEAEVLFDLLQP